MEVPRKQCPAPDDVHSGRTGAQKDQYDHLVIVLVIVPAMGTILMCV